MTPNAAIAIVNSKIRCRIRSNCPLDKVLVKEIERLREALICIGREPVENGNFHLAAMAREALAKDE